MKLVLIVALAVVVIAGAFASPGDTELRAYTSFTPRFAEDFGAGIAVQFASFPEDWAVIGGRMVFFDAIQLDTKTIFGGSISFRPESADNGMRFWGAFWQDSGGQWAAGVSTRVANW